MTMLTEEIKTLGPMEPRRAMIRIGNTVLHDVPVNLTSDGRVHILGFKVMCLDKVKVGR